MPALVVLTAPPFSPVTAGAAAAADQKWIRVVMP